MKCDVCGKSARSFYVYPKGNGDFGVRCVEWEQLADHWEQELAKMK